MARDRMNCPDCGVDNPTGASFCRECGAGLKTPQPQFAAPKGAELNALKSVQDAPLGGTLVVASRPPVPPPDINGTLASAHDVPQQLNDALREMADVPAPHTPSPHAHRQAEAPAVVARMPEPSAKLCRACGAASGPTARFCQLCGLPLDRGSGERPRSNPPEIAPQSIPEADLVVIAQDGSPGRRYPLAGVRTSIGSADSDICLRKDPYVSPLHAQISYRNGRFYLEDRGSLNGVFVRLGGSVPLTSGDLLLLGLGVLRFEIVDESERNLAPQSRNGTRVFGTPPAPRYARLTIQTVEGVARDRFYLSRVETVLGREVGDIVFTDDPFMSRRHAAIRRDPNTNHFTIRDLGSSNGTFIALRAEHALSPGDHIRIGQHLFRLDVRSSR
jgi:pSer/pThr/pTyr-binding forkhead associated (FHA) protein/ribosomal protein L40E